MNIKPIPDMLLGDSFTLQIPSESGYTEKEIYNVRIVRTNSIGDYVRETPRDNTEITVWYDCENSYPEAEFSAGMKILYCGETFEITEVKIFRASKPHHIRLKATKIEGEYKEVN